MQPRLVRTATISTLTRRVVRVRQYKKKNNNKKKSNASNNNNNNMLSEL